jgi:hypothetical protein
MWRCCPARSLGGQLKNDSSQGTSQPITYSWQGDKALQTIANRLSRSATIALLLSPVGLLFISSTRLLIISDYNPDTASAIVSSSGYVNTLLGTIIPLVPIIMPYLALILLFFNRVIAGILALITAAFISPATMSRPDAMQFVVKNWNQITHTPAAPIIGLLAAATAFLLFVELIGISFSAFARTIGTILCITLIPAVAQLYPPPITNQFYANLIRQPWLSAETITLSSGKKLVGYALSSDGTWIEILREDNRKISYYLASDITRRQVCQIEQSPSMQPLIALTPERTNVSPRTPTCQTSSIRPSIPARPSYPTTPLRGPRP